MHSLAADSVAENDLGHRRSGYYFHDCVIALLHDAQLHEHGPATLRRELGHDGACPDGRCQASGEAVVSRISRTWAVLPRSVPSLCDNFLYGFKGALTRAKTSGQGRSGLDKGTLAAALFGLGRAGQRQPDRRTAYGPPPLVKSAAPFARGCRQPDGSGAKSGETMTTRATASAGNDGDGPRPGRRPGAPSLARGR